MSNKNINVLGECHNRNYRDASLILLRTNINGLDFTPKPNFGNHLSKLLKFSFSKCLSLAKLTLTLYFKERRTSSQFIPPLKKWAFMANVL